MLLGTPYDTLSLSACLQWFNTLMKTLQTGCDDHELAQFVESEQDAALRS